MKNFNEGTLITVLGKIQRAANRKESMSNRQVNPVATRRRAIDNAYTASFTGQPEKTTPFWIGHCCQTEQTAGEIAVTIKQKGELPEILKNDVHTTIHVTVSLGMKNAEQKKDVCIVREGKQLQSSTVVFDKLTSECAEGAKLSFEVSFVTGRFFKRKDLIQKWTVSIEGSNLNDTSCNWTLMKKLF